MSKLTIFDKYTTPDDWKENALEPERSRKKIYVKRFSAAALICTFAVVFFAAYGLMHMTENKPESGRDSAQSIESQNAHDTDLNNSSDSFFIAERSGVHFRGYIAQKYENSYMLYSYDGDSDSYSLMSVSFTDDCKFYGEQNGEIKSYNYDIGDEVIVNFDGMVMESYPAQINSCSIFQKVDSLKDGECLIDSMQTYFSAKVAEVLNTEAGERTIKVEAMKDGAAYTVYNLCGFVYDEFNNVIPFEQLKEGDLIKVGYNGNLELSDVSEISTDIIQKTPQRDFIVSKYDSDGLYEALSDDGRVSLRVEYIRDASEHKIIVKTTYKNLSDETITLGDVHSDDAAILHRYGEEAARNCDYETLYLKPGEEKVLCDSELAYEKWGYYILDIYLGFEYFDPETMQGDGAGSRLSTPRIEKEIYIPPNEFSQS